MYLFGCCRKGKTVTRTVSGCHVLCTVVCLNVYGRFILAVSRVEPFQLPCDRVIIPFTLFSIGRELSLQEFFCFADLLPCIAPMYYHAVIQLEVWGIADHG